MTKKIINNFICPAIGLFIVFPALWLTDKYSDYKRNKYTNTMKKLLKKICCWCGYTNSANGDNCFNCGRPLPFMQ